MEIHSFFVLALLLVSLSSPSSSDASRRVLRLSRAVSVPRARWDQSAPVSAIVGPRPGIYHSSSPSVSSPYHGRPSYYYSNARMVAAPSAYYPKVSRKRDVVVFNSPEASYQYDTGFPAGTGAASNAKLTKESEESKEEETRDIRKAADAITENRIKLASKSLYSYKVIRPRDVVSSSPPRAFFVKQKAHSAPKAIAVTRTKQAPVVVSPYRVVKPAPAVTPRPSRTISVGYAPYHRGGYRHQRHHLLPSTYGVSLPPASSSSTSSFRRYPSSLTANTLVHRPVHHARPHPLSHAVLPPPRSVGVTSSSSSSYSSLVKSRASKGNTKVIRPSFTFGSGLGATDKKKTKSKSKKKAASMERERGKKKKEVMTKNQPSSFGVSTTTSTETSDEISELQKLVGLAAALEMPDKRKRNKKKKEDRSRRMRTKKKEPTVIKPFSTTNFKPIESLRDFVGNGFSSGSAIDVSQELDMDQEEVDEQDDYDYNGERGVTYAGFKLNGDSDYEDDKNVRYDYMYEVSNKNNSFGHSRIESREGDQIRGQYKVQLPDGRTQVVDYTADENGFHPTITYEGEATEAPSKEQEEEEEKMR